ncbi:MAG TPA: hypothetical protein PLU52_08760, partial [Opitutaceae bacterium]|nr:hypothetical protein [Opitutaceae bacterium]
LSCPGIVTLALELPLASAAIGAELEQRGILVNFRSPHLLARNWLQVSLLGDPPADALDTLRAALQALGVGRPTVAPVLQTA